MIKMNKLEIIKEIESIYLACNYSRVFEIQNKLGDLLKKEHKSQTLEEKSLRDYIKLSENVKIHKQIMEENWKLRMDKLKLEKEIRELKEENKII